MGIAIDLISYYSSCWFDDIVGSPQLLRSESLWGASPVGSQLRCGSSIPGADDAPHGASRRRQGGFKWAATPRWITVWHHRGKQHGTTILKSFVFFFWGGRTVHFIRVNYKNLTLRRHWNGWLRGNHPRHGFIAISPETSWCISPLVALT